MSNYWTATHTTAVKEYCEAESSPNKDAIRENIINRTLYKPLYTMSSTCLKSFDIKVNEDDTQDIILHLITKTLPKISEDKVDYALSYLWTASRNFTINYIVNKKKHPTEDVEKYSHSIAEEVDQDAMDDRNTQRKRIMDNIDLLIRGQKIVNTTNSVFLLLLKQYIIDNDFDIRGFGDYIMETMHLKLNTYRAIAGRLKIRTKELNEKVLGK